MSCTANSTPKACATLDDAYAEANCTAPAHASVIKNPHCPPETPYSPMCSSPQSNSRFCCQNMNADTDPSCNVCPSSAECNEIMGNASSGVCFAQSTNCGENTNPSRPGQKIKTCPVMTSNDPGAVVCQTWCTANPAACNASMRAYCKSTTYAESPACACIAHTEDWGFLSYDDLQAIVDANPAVQKQLDSQDGAIDISCVWPPCQGQVSVMTPKAVDDSFACPQHIDNLCVNLVADIQFKDVVAGTINVGACINEGNGGGGGGSGNSNTQVRGGISTLPFGTQLSVWLGKNPLIIVVTITLFVIILASLMYLAFRPPTTLQLAEAEMTMAELQKRRQQKMNVLMDTMLASTNPTVRQAGDKMRTRRRDIAAGVAKRWRAESDAIAAKVRELRPYAHSNAQAGMQIAGLQAQAQMFRRQAKKLDASLGIKVAELE